MPRVRNPGSGKPPHNQPAKGAGIGGPRAGEGWGGAARGTGTRPAITPEAARRLIAMKDDPQAQAERDEWNAQMLTVLATVAVEGDADASRVNAADKFLDRLNGKAKQQTDITSGGDRLGYVIAAPPEAADAEEWASQHKPH